MHVGMEFRDTLTPDGVQAVEFKISNLEEIKPEDLEKEISPVGWIAEVISVLMSTGQMTELIDSYKADLAAKQAAQAQAEQNVAQLVKKNLET